MGTLAVKDYKHVESAIIVTVCALLIAFLIIGCAITQNVQTEEPYPKDLWKGLIAEAVDQGYKGMYAVACVYKNRLDKDMTLGSAGLARKDLEEFVVAQGPKYELWAKDIIWLVFEVGAVDKTYGATHFDSTDFPKPEWAKHMEVTTQIGKHIFYKEKD